MATTINYAGREYAENEIESGTVSNRESLDMSELSVDSCEFIVKPYEHYYLDGADPYPLFTKDGYRLKSTEENPLAEDLPNGAMLAQSENGELIATWYLEDKEQVGNSYKLHGVTALEMLSNIKHYGGLYSNVNASDIAADICGSIPFIMQENLQNDKIYGWLPIDSARNNLQRLVMRLGTALTIREDGALIIGDLETETVASVGGGDICVDGANVKDSSAVSGVVVLAHGYEPTNEERTLFDGGSAGITQRITFSEPMHSLTWTPTGGSGSTLYNGAGMNYADITGEGVLTGKTYRHTTLEYVRDVWKQNNYASVVNSSATLAANTKYKVTIAGNVWNFTTSSALTADNWIAAAECNFHPTKSKGGKGNSGKIELLTNTASGYKKLGVFDMSYGNSGTALPISFIFIPVSSNTENVVHKEDNAIIDTAVAGEIADKLSVYYDYTKTINVSVLDKNLAAGNVIDVVDPYTGDTAVATVSQCLTALSKVRKDTISAVKGFVPQNANPKESVFDWITTVGDTTYRFDDIDDNTEVTFYIGGGGDGGTHGKDGTKGQNRSGNCAAGVGGNGGAGGAKGLGGKTLMAKMTIAHAGDTVTIHVGAGGQATENENDSARKGKNSTVKYGNITKSSKNGTRTPIWDATNGEYYGISGEDGANGMPGGDGGEPGKYGKNGTDYNEIYTGGQGSIGWTNNLGNGVYEKVGGLGGGGAAKGESGGDPGTITVYSRTYSIGGKGGNGETVAAAVNYCDGGNGGNGGGGGGGARGYNYNGSDQSSIQHVSYGGEAGTGSNGTDGMSGIVGVQYRKRIQPGG